MKLCGCIDAPNRQAALKLLELRPDLAEHRLDLMDIPEFIESDIPLIATCRPEFLGGKYAEDEKSRFALLKRAIESWYPYVDIELESDEMMRDELIAFAKEKGCKVIISTHDFKSTPDDLPELLDIMTKSGADIAKIVTSSDDTKDCRRMMELYNRSSIPLIAFCMGTMGRFTRIFSLFLGAPFSYVSLGKPTAPGQFSLEEMKKLIEEIR